MGINIIDLFAGCGGLSKGFEQASYNVVGFVENWEPAIKTHKFNFPNSELLGKDIEKISDEDIFAIKNKFGKIHGIIGGPPCQGFSTIGKRDQNDPRNKLFRRFIRFIEIIEPDFFVMENVRGLLSTKDHFNKPIINTITDQIENLGYKVNFKLLRAADYGVPQLRDRVVILGSKLKKLNFPNTTHTEREWVTIDEAIGNLPKLNNRHRGSEILKINIPHNTDYQKYISNGCYGELFNHEIHLQNKLDVERSKFIPEGRYLRTTRGGLKNDIFPEKKLYLNEGSYKQQKYCRLDRNLPSMTVLTDWNTMRQKIHPSQDRPFSVREVARLQSFPDNFIFLGKLKDQYKQIGNAVPVILAKKIAEEIIKELYIGKKNYIIPLISLHNENCAEINSF